MAKTCQAKHAGNSQTETSITNTQSDPLRQRTRRHTESPELCFGGQGENELNDDSVTEKYGPGNHWGLSGEGGRLIKVILLG